MLDELARFQQTEISSTEWIETATSLGGSTLMPQHGIYSIAMSFPKQINFNI